MVLAAESQRAMVDSGCDSLLDNPAVYTVGGHVVRLIQEPESFPFLQDRSEVIRGVDQLLRTSRRLG
jgi:hypothetical protein